MTSNNLRLLAEHLKDKEVFMQHYFNGEFPDEAYQLKDNNVTQHWCGTSACALGWATTLFEVKPEHFDDNGYFNIDRFGAEYFPELYDILRFGAECFPDSYISTNAHWSEVFRGSLPNEGAAERCINMADKLDQQCS